MRGLIWTMIILLTALLMDLIMLQIAAHDGHHHPSISIIDLPLDTEKISRCSFWNFPYRGMISMMLNNSSNDGDQERRQLKALLRTTLIHHPHLRATIMNST
jgi:hypothetical protein